MARSLRGLFVRAAVLPFALACATGLPSAALAQPAGLEYKYREPFKNADYYLVQIEGNLEKMTAQVNGATAKDAPQSQANIDALRKFLTNAKTHLTKLPAPEANKDVKGLYDRADAAAKAIDELQKMLDARVSGTKDAVNAEAKALQADIDKLGEWGKLFANPQTVFAQSPDDALVLVERMTDVENEWKVILERWHTLLDQSNHSQEAGKIQAAASYFNRSLPGFKQYMEQLKKDLPGQIATDQKRNDEFISTAINDKNTVLLSGMRDGIDRAAERLKLLKGLDTGLAAPLIAEQDRIEARWTETARTLRGDIIKGNEVPQPNYAGEDVASLRELVLKRWKELHPTDEVLVIVFNTPGWKRTTRWDWNKGNSSFEKVDFSHLQPKLIVKFDDTLALVVPVDIYKDHLQGDVIRLSPWDREKDPNPRNLLLLDRVRK